MSDTRAGLRDLLAKHAEPAYRMAHVVGSAYGNPSYKAQEVSHQTLIAFPFDDKPCLIQFDDKCQPEEVDYKLPTVAIGSGQPQADTFLAFIRSLLWPKDGAIPTLHEAIFTTLWTLKNVIDASPGGVAGPIRLVVLERSANGKSWKARELSPDDYQEDLQKIEKVREGIRRVVLTGGLDEVALPDEPSDMPGALDLQSGKPTG
jgi:hypothetical protein